MDGQSREWIWRGKRKIPRTSENYAVREIRECPPLYCSMFLISSLKRKCEGKNPKNPEPYLEFGLKSNMIRSGDLP